MVHGVLVTFFNDRKRVFFFLVVHLKNKFMCVFPSQNKGTVQNERIARKNFLGILRGIGYISKEGKWYRECYFFENMLFEIIFYTRANNLRFKNIIRFKIFRG